MAKKISIRGCIGCAMCTNLCPELFEMDDSFHAYPVNGEDAEIPEDLEDSASQAQDYCPVNAICIEE